MRGVCPTSLTQALTLTPYALILFLSYPLRTDSESEVVALEMRDIMGERH